MMLASFAPEIMLFLTFLTVILLEIFWSSQRQKSKTDGVFVVSFIGLLATMVLGINFLDDVPQDFFQGTMMVDAISQYFKLVFVFAAVFSLVSMKTSKECSSQSKTEFFSMILLMCLGCCLFASSIHLLTTFIVLEIIFLCLFSMSAFSNKAQILSKSGLNLLVIASVLTLFFVFASLVIYNFTGTFSFLEIRQKLIHGPNPPEILFVAYGLFFVVLAILMNLFPFQFPFPGVFHGSSAPVATVLAVFPTVLGINLLIKVFLMAFSVRNSESLVWSPVPGFQWTEVVPWIVGFSLTFSNLGALSQSNLKRMFSFSTMSQGGLLLLGFSVANFYGIRATLFGLFSFVICTLGTTLIIKNSMDEERSEDLSVLKGLVWVRPFEGVALCIFLLGLSGLPPFSGFVGRAYLLDSVIHSKDYWLSLVACSNLVLSLVFYFKLLALIFERPTEEAQKDLLVLQRQSGAAVSSMSNVAYEVAILVLLIPTISLGVYWDPFMLYISNSLKNILW